MDASANTLLQLSVITCLLSLAATNLLLVILLLWSVRRLRDALSNLAPTLQLCALLLRSIATGSSTEELLQREVET